MARLGPPSGGLLFAPVAYLTFCSRSPCYNLRASDGRSAMDRRQTARQKPTPAVRHRRPLHTQYAEVLQLRQMVLDVESGRSDRFIASADSGDVEWTFQPAL